MFKLFDDIPVWGDPVDEGALTQIKEARKDAAYAAMMGDHHLGYAVPIGGVVAYRNAVSPSGVGYDIGCGNKAIKLDVSAEMVKQHGINEVLDELWHTLSFGVGRTRAVQDDSDINGLPLWDHPAWDIPEVGALKEMAYAQLGTIGSGNHYVDIFGDTHDNVWVGVHFGSRGLGHKIATHFLKAGGAKDAINATPLVLGLDTDLGQQYMSAMELAGEYAYAGRDWVCAQVSNLFGGRILKEVHNHHNYAWRETHFGEDLIVVRKGATPAFPGQEGFVGGSMGEPSYILHGRDSEESRIAMHSTVHGAGRVMSRTAAAGKFDRKKKEYVTKGAISPEMMNEWLQKAGVALRGGGLDEAPQAYKRLHQVIGSHLNTIDIDEVLYPMGVLMAGASEFDPYKD